MSTDVRTHRNQLLSFIGLVLATASTMFVIAGSGVFVSAAVVALHGVQYLGLIFTVESLARCAIVPFSGKLGDKYGRKPLFLISAVGYMLASLVCGLAGTIVMFIVGRILMGLTWGLFFANTFVMIADIFPPDDSPKMTGYLQSFGIAAMLVAAPLCGVFADIWTWRLTFYVVIPFLFVACFLIAKFMPAGQERKSAPMDILGVLFLTIALVPFSLAMAWGGTSYAWNSLPILAMLGVTALSTLILILVERKAADPIFPSNIIKNKNYMMMFLLSFFFTLVYTTGNFLPSFAQMVLHTSATVSGVLLLPAMLVSVIGASVLGNYIAKKGKYKGITFFFTVTALGTTLMYFFFDAQTTIIYILVSSVIVGLAQTVQQVAPMTYPLSVLKPGEIATGMAFIVFGQSFANTISNGIFTALANTGLINVFHFSIILALFMIPACLFFKDKQQSEVGSGVRGVY